MLKTKKIGRVALPSLLALSIVLFAFSLPAHAAEIDGNGTTGDTEASVTFTPGEIRLISAPTLDFGSNIITDEEKSYPATSMGANARVSDLRGSGEGWDLVVALSKFHLDSNDEETLQGATITIVDPNVSAINGNIGAPPSQVTELVLTSDGVETPVWNAPTGTGMGVWDLEWQAANSTLTVKPGTVQNGKSVASMTWSLQSTP